MNGTIDTLDFSRKLRRAGLEEQVADAVASEMARYFAAVDFFRAIARRLEIFRSSALLPQVKSAK